MRPFLVMLVFSCAGVSQQQPAASSLMTDQQIARTLTAISLHAARIEPMLQQLKPNDWVAKGAPDTYVAQWNSTLGQFRAIQSDMAALAQRPDRMTECMKALFRAQASHQILSSLVGGLRRYQNPALADLIESVAAEDRGDLDRFQQYVLELANEKERQFAVVDAEAQRCRAALSRQPAEPARKRSPQ